jgi:hypothetical protein
MRQRMLYPAALVSVLGKEDGPYQHYSRDTAEAILVHLLDCQVLLLSIRPRAR